MRNFENEYTKPSLNKESDAPKENRNRKVYDDSFKYQIIEEVCNGKSVSVAAKEHKINILNVYNWLNLFVQKGALSDKELSEEEKIRFEKLREKAIKVKSEMKPGRGKGAAERVVYQNSFKYQIIEEFCDGKAAYALATEYGIPYATIYKWLKDFAEKGAFGNKVLSKEEALRIEHLKTQIIERMNHSNKYDASFKYRVIEELCNDKSIAVVAKQFDVTRITVYNWLRNFVHNGTLDDATLLKEDTALTQEEVLRIEQLRERAKKREEEIEEPKPKYDTSFKYQLIEAYCDGESTYGITEKYGIGKGTFQRWLREFIQDGALDDEVLTPEESLKLEKLRKRAMENKPAVKRYETSFKYQLIEEFSNGKSLYAIGKDFGINVSVVYKWVNDFIENGVVDDAVLSQEEKLRVEQLREKIKVRNEKKFRYEASFKYQIIEELCNGKAPYTIEKEYGVDSQTVRRWLKEFIENGAFNDEAELSQKEKLWIKQLREKAAGVKLSEKPRKIKKPEPKYESSFKYVIIEKLCEGNSISAIQEKYGVSSAHIVKWMRNFIKHGKLGDEKLTQGEAEWLNQLREKAIKRGQIKLSYDAPFKYKIIEEFCNGKTPNAIEEEYGVSAPTVYNWFRAFVKNGPFNAASLSKEEKMKYEQLREKAIILNPKISR